MIAPFNCQNPFIHNQINNGAEPRVEKKRAFRIIFYVYKLKTTTTKNVERFFFGCSLKLPHQITKQKTYWNENEKPGKSVFGHFSIYVMYMLSCWWNLSKVKFQMLYNRCLVGKQKANKSRTWTVSYKITSWNDFVNGPHSPFFSRRCSDITRQAANEQIICKLHDVSKVNRATQTKQANEPKKTQ